MTEIDDLQNLRDRLIRERRNIGRGWNRDDPLNVAERIQKAHSLLKAVEEAIEHERSLGAAVARPAPAPRSSLSGTARAEAV